jgi:hypothetical protein
MARRTVTNHWFVSVEVPRQGRLASLNAPARETKTFPTEAEAKQYAKEILSDSRNIIAGALLNGYQPVRRIIPASDLNRWKFTQAHPLRGSSQDACGSLP